MNTHLTQLSNLNAYTFNFDINALRPLRELYRTYIFPVLKQHPHLLNGDAAKNASIHIDNHKLYLTSYGESPLLWISNDDRNSYTLFENFLNKTHVVESAKALINHHKNLVMYSGFYVVGDHLNHELWHTDYLPGANAYTLITPLFDLEQQHGQLLYKDAQQRNQRYEYTLGEGIIFGDGFVHTTEPYAKSGQRALLSVTFGTDKKEYWPLLEKTIGMQSRFMLLPCGHQAGSCECVELKFRDKYIASV